MRDKNLEPVLELTNATLVRGGTRVLDGLSLAIHHGEHTVILGPNGAGKSSLIRLLTFEDRPRLGENGSAPMRIFGQERWDVSALRTRFGVVTGELDHGFGLETSSGRVSGLDVATSGLLGSHGVFSHHERHGRACAHARGTRSAVWTRLTWRSSRSTRCQRANGGAC